MKTNGTIIQRQKKQTYRHTRQRLFSSLFRLLFGLILDFLVEEVSGNGVDDTVEEGKALNKLPDAEQFESKKESCHR